MIFHLLVAVFLERKKTKNRKGRIGEILLDYRMTKKERLTKVVLMFIM